MAANTWGQEYRTTVICVDTYENQMPQGRFYNPYLSGGETFHSMVELLLKMEQALNEMEFPRSFTAARTFAPPPKTGTDPPEPEAMTGEKATFAVRVMFRQNASWQGSVTWLEGRKEQSFRSVLELILLMDSALTADQAA